MRISMNTIHYKGDLAKILTTSVLVVPWPYPFPPAAVEKWAKKAERWVVTSGMQTESSS